jgi:competence protein ComEA
MIRGVLLLWALGAVSPALASPPRSGVLLAGDTGTSALDPLGDVEARSSQRLIHLNDATVEELCTLPGIGKKRAEAILAARERRPFTRLTQLLQVKGIGPKMLQRLKPRLTLEPRPAADGAAGVADDVVEQVVDQAVEQGVAMALRPLRSELPLRPATASRTARPLRP